MRQPPEHRRAREVIRGLGALTTMLAFLAGLPAGLAIVAGSPIPHTVPSWAQITTTLTAPDTGGTVFVSTVKLIGWVAWCSFAVATLAEVVAYVRGRPARLLPWPLRPMQYMARDLVAMIALIASTGAPTPLSAALPLTHHAAATSHHTRPAAIAASTLAADAAPANQPSQEAARGADTSKDRSWRTRIIKRGDTLWAIACQSYRSGSRYPRIFNASKDLHQPGSLPRITQPDRIYPGQRIKIPHPHDGAKRPTARPEHTEHRPSTSPPPRSFGRPHTPERKNPQPPATASTRPDATLPPQETPSTAQGTRSKRPVGGGTTSRNRPAPRPYQRPSGSDGRGEGEHHDGAPAGVHLPAGGYAGLGLAAAISLTFAAARLHRRRRRAGVGEWPSPDIPEPHPTQAVAKLRKTHLDTYTDRDQPVPSDADLIAQDLLTPSPTQLTAGTRDGHDLVIDLAGFNLGLVGPAALDVVRAIATELLAKSNRYRVELIIPEPDATTLFADTGIDATELATAVPGLIVPASLGAAITHLEAEVIHRARLMETTDQPTVPDLRHADPGEPLPAILIVATAPADGSDALRAVLQLGATYCVGGLLLGHWPAGTSVHLDAHATVTGADGPEAHMWNSARLFRLPPADAAPMLQLIRAATGAPDTSRTSTTAPAETNDDRIDNRVETGRPVSDPPASSVPRAETYARDDGGSRSVTLHVLGPVRIEAAGEPITTGLRRIARDLLVYLALNRRGITLEQGIDALMPDRDLDTGTTMFHTAINNVRKTLRNATGSREPMFIIHASGRYHLDPNLIEVDLWQLQTALHKAHDATTDTDRIMALQTIPDLYAGELAEDLYYDWAEAERENFRRRATDALTHLARLQQDDQPDQAIAILEQAINHDPYAEILYQELMRLQTRLNRPDAAHRTYQLLTNRLADLDTQPGAETQQLHQNLLPHT